MKILAILQNTWAKDPERVHALLDRNRDRRHDVVARSLFRQLHLASAGAGNRRAPHFQSAGGSGWEQIHNAPQSHRH